MIYMWKKNIPDYSSTGHGNSCKKHHRAVNQKTNFYFQCKKPSFLRQYLLSSKISFFIIKITLPLLWAKNQNFNKIFHLKVSGVNKNGNIFPF